MAGNRVIPAIIHFNKVLCCVASWLARSVRSFAHQKSDQLGAVQMMRLCGIQRVSIADDHEGLECLARLTAHFDRLGRMCVELRFSVEQVLQNCRCCSATCCTIISPPPLCIILSGVIHQEQNQWELKSCPQIGGCCGTELRATVLVRWLWSKSALCNRRL